MTKEEEIADHVWVYIEEYVSLRIPHNGDIYPKEIAKTVKKLDRELRKAIRSRSK